ncbi:hypothetical protein Hanom_Chr05g00414391 [Helianthus anomalus]
MHASKSPLGNDITKSYLASYAQEYSGTVGIGGPRRVEYLVGVHILKDLAYLLPLWNEDTSPVTPIICKIFYVQICGEHKES